MEVNTNPVTDFVECPPAYVSEAHTGVGVFALYDNFNQYLAEQAEADAESLSATESAPKSYELEVGSTSGQTLVRIPEGIYNLNHLDIEQRAVLTESVVSLLDMTEVYLDALGGNPDIAGYEVPSSSIGSYKTVKEFIFNLQANGVPEIPFFPPENTDAYTGDQFTKHKAMIGDKETEFTCRQVGSQFGVEICSANSNVYFLYLDNGKFIAATLATIGVIAQEYPVALPHLAKLLGDIEATYSSPTAFTAFIQGVESNRKSDTNKSVPNIPGSITPPTTRAKYDINPDILRRLINRDAKQSQTL